MSALRQVLLGALAATLSTIIVMGSLALSLAERGIPVAVLPTSIYSATPLPPVDTPEPGQPTYTPSPMVEQVVISTETPVATLDCLHPADWIQINVELGQTWEEIAQIYGSTEQELRTYNCLDSGPLARYSDVTLYVPNNTPATPSPTPSLTPTNTLRPTSTPTLCVVNPPASWVRYTVRSGDTLSSIGSAHNIAWTEIKRVNCITGSKIYVGQVLYVPYVAPSATPRPPTATPTQIILTNTPLPPTNTPLPPSATPVTPSKTPVPASPTPTASPLPPSPTSAPPSDTPLPPTPTNTPVPPTATSPAIDTAPAPTLADTPGNGSFIQFDSGY